MGKLFKTLILVAPVLAIVFYYVVIKHAEQHKEIQKKEAEFSRDWNEESKAFAKTKADKAKYAKRAADADKEVQKADEEIKPHSAKVDAFGKDFDKAIKDAGEANK